MNPETADRLANLNIQLLAEAKAHYLFGRDACVALVERTETGFGSIGGTGIMTSNGLAYLVWRDGRAWLAGKGGQSAAEAAQVEAIRRFSEDLRHALERG